MKYVLGVFALLLLVSTLALGQSYQPLPFPQEANTALQGGPDNEMAPDVNLPSSMAANQGEEVFIYHGGGTALGSPFPSAANPSLDRSNADETTPSWREERRLGSPFPAAANPAHEEEE
ncbi:MAG: hypothetical protein WA532_05180 [Candidatus Korobacteraceae bacterium]